MEDDPKKLGSRGLQLAHLNVASILGTRKLDMMKIQLEESDFDIFCASETWLNEEIPDSLVSKRGFNGWIGDGRTKRRIVG